LSEDQPVVFAIQRIVFINRVKNNLKQNLNDFRTREKHTSNLYWFTLIPRATFSPQKPLVSTMQSKSILQTYHQRIDLEYLKSHTSFGTQTPQKSEHPLILHLHTSIQKYKRYIKDYT